MSRENPRALDKHAPRYDRQEHPAFYTPRTISMPQNEIWHQETQSCTRSSSLNGKGLLWHPRFPETRLLSVWLKHCLLHAHCQPHRHVRGAWLAIQGATDHSNMKWELVSNVLYLIISIKCHRVKEWQRREGTLFPHRMTLQQRDLTSPGHRQVPVKLSSGSIIG